MHGKGVFLFRCAHRLLLGALSQPWPWLHPPRLVPVSRQKPYNLPCAQQYVGKSQSCMVISGSFLCRGRRRSGGLIGLFRRLCCSNMCLLALGECQCPGLRSLDTLPLRTLASYLRFG